MNDFFTFALLVRIPFLVTLLGYFALVHFEKGIRLRRSSMAFLLYFSVALVAQILQVMNLVTIALWFVAIPGTLTYAILVGAMTLDLRKHYRENGGNHRQDR